MDANNPSSSGYMYLHEKAKRRRSLLTAEVYGLKKPLDHDIFLKYCQHQLNNVRIRVEPDEELARIYNKAVPIYPHYTTTNNDVLKTSSDEPRNTLDSVTRRPQEEKKKGQRKWFWTFIGLSISISASIIAYSYAAEGGEHESLPTGDDTDPQV